MAIRKANPKAAPASAKANGKAAPAAVKGKGKTAAKPEAERKDNRYLRASRIIVKNLDINAEALAIAASMSESTAGHCLAAWEGVTQALREAKRLPDKAAKGKAPEPAP